MVYEKHNMIITLSNMSLPPKHFCNSKNILHYTLHCKQNNVKLLTCPKRFYIFIDCPKYFQIISRCLIQTHLTEK